MKMTMTIMKSPLKNISKNYENGEPRKRWRPRGAKNKKSRKT